MLCAFGEVGKHTVRKATCSALLAVVKPDTRHTRVWVPVRLGSMVNSHAHTALNVDTTEPSLKVWKLTGHNNNKEQSERQTVNN